MNIEVYGKEDCTYCARTKQLLESKNLTYDYFDVEVDATLNEASAFRAGGYRKVPRIFIDNQFIAGYDGLRDWLKKQAA